MRKKFVGFLVISAIFVFFSLWALNELFGGKVSGYSEFLVLFFLLFVILMAIFATKVFVGFLVIIAFITIFGGGSGFYFFVFSIICTAGISLVLWLPFAYLIGSGIFKLISLYRKKEKMAGLKISRE